MNLQEKSSAGLCVLNANSLIVKIHSSKAGYDLFLLIVQYQAE